MPSASTHYSPVWTDVSSQHDVRVSVQRGTGEVLIDQADLEPKSKKAEKIRSKNQKMDYEKSQTKKVTDVTE